MSEIAGLLLLGTMVLQSMTLWTALTRGRSAQDTLERERAAWAAERERLLDRIQAPSFAELKTAEVKVIKAQQGHKDPAPLEPV